MIDWEALRSDLPRITEQLVDMMTEDAIPAVRDGVLAWPAVEIAYTTKDGETFKVRLSIDQDTPEPEDGR